MKTAWWMMTAVVLAFCAQAWAQPAPDQEDACVGSEPPACNRTCPARCADGVWTCCDGSTHPAGAAAGAESGANRGDGYVEVLNHVLDLTPAQRKAVKGILDKSQPERETLEKQMHELGEKMHKQRRADSEKIRVLLNDDQKEKFDSFNSRMNPMMMHPMMGPERMRQHQMMRGPMPDGSMPPPEMWHHGKKAPSPEETKPGDNKPDSGDIPEVMPDKK